LGAATCLELFNIGREDEGFGDLISGCSEDLMISGSGERNLVGIDLSGEGNGLIVVFVPDLLTAGFFPLCGVVFCSNIPIRRVVGGIGLVSRT